MNFSQLVVSEFREAFLVEVKLVSIQIWLGKVKKVFHCEKVYG